MAWSNSRIFSNTVKDIFENTTAMDANADTYKAALFDTTVTPSQTVASASTAYGAGVWASGGVVDASGWPAVGRNLVVTSALSTATYVFDSADTVSANSSTTLAGVFGTLVYDDTITTPVADQGLCYNYFGGTQGVTAGTFTIVWNASGVMALTL